MFDNWFKSHKANQRFISTAEKTFKTGGYYCIDINDNISLISLNTLYFNSKQQKVTEENKSIALYQMDWLKQLLSHDSRRKYIILTHIYAGARIKHNQN
jgi:hypothetical protein